MLIYRLLGLALVFFAISLFVEGAWWAGTVCFLIGGGMAAVGWLRRPRRHPKGGKEGKEGLL
ncbi:hypothetical protein M493_08635 [Geobacillus genomosp. 3]|uniref:Uncharacterized protein n=1 Tax=Geobacillus genomosp. 3 TaxID=1921421 RepID=S5Z4Y1_GEOG3|nr:hypothetical protein [Geobacillus genomosp. 3]AGT32002.1 hypothetical protein M493_08635 [Geobacillus genomosp. 3]